MGISAGIGLASGLETESIISQMMAIEQRPILLLQQKEAAYQAKISALGGLKGGLSALQSAVTDLKDADSFFSFNATSGNSDVLTLSASQNAEPGQHQVVVSALAQAQQVRSAAFTGSDEVVGTGTLTIQVGTGTSFDVVIDSEHETLTGIATAINEAETDVAAGVIHDGNGNYYLTLVSSETGLDNTISFSLQDDDTINNDAAGLSALYTDPATQVLTETQAAANAEVTVNGIAIERAGNTIDDLIPGLTMTLQQADPGNPFVVDVSRNLSSVTGKIQAFIEKYNSLVDTLSELQDYNPETGAGGILQGDSATRFVGSKLSNLLYAEVDGVADEVNSLSRLGVEVDRDGKLSLNTSTFTTALEEHREDVVTFFTQDEDGNEGIAHRLDTVLASYLKGSTGLLAEKEKGMQSSIDDIGDQIERITFRLAKREENLRAQFLTLESLLADFQATSGALEQQLQNLANLSSSIYGKK